MATESDKAAVSSPAAEAGQGTDISRSTAATQLGSATYEVIRQRLQAQGAALRERMSCLDARRREVFGSIEFKLLQADRITTAHNCIPQDMVQLGRGRFLFGFNVHFGLRKQMELSDVFAIYARDEETGTFKESSIELLQDGRFMDDFQRIYNVYAKAFFSKFSLIDGNLYMVFHVGAGASDIAVLKWRFNGGQLGYLDGRAESEFRRIGFPAPYQFRWQIPDRQSFRYGDHPHVSIEDRVFVDCVRGDLTIKVEDSTATGEGIYSEAVEDKYQKVDDAEIAYALIGHLILLKIKPYKEAAARHFIFNEKTQSVVRVDSIGQSCALLPEDHGLIFPDGYYLATGELKLFEAKENGMTIERVIHAPNGEDSLFVFFNRETGQYVLLPYRLIDQKVPERITCNGFSLFPDGHLLLFRAEEEAQKHHLIQLRQTPFHSLGYEPPGKRDAFLYQVGNKDVVRCLAECNEVLTLIRKENPYAELYADLVKRCGAMIDSYPWLSNPDGFQVDAALRQIRETADRAVDEFDKVRRLQREAAERVKDVRQRCEEQFRTARRARFVALDEFVQNLSALRQLRGELITLKEVRFADVAQIEEAERAVVAQSNEISANCVKFLLQPPALEPYRARAAEQLAAVDQVTKAADAKSIERAVLAAGGELELLIEIVNSLKIEDATESTRIIDGITAIYSTLNQVKGALKKRLQELVAKEGAAQFSAQLKLLSQAAASYLDLCDSPAKCDEYLNRITVQIEELEGAFADFEEYIVQLAEKRTALYEAFEQRKVAMVEQRNRKASALLGAAERILKVIQNRLAGFKAIEEINTYMAADLMIVKIREIVSQLRALEDSVKAEDLEGRLKSAQQEAVRQLKDRQELFVGGQAVIQLGKHRFAVNTQPLDLTIVNRDGVQHVHLTSTKYFDAITDEALEATRDVWDQEVVSENPRVYRAEYLAYQVLRSVERGHGKTVEQLLALSESERLAVVQEFMAAQYQDGYTKGIHDVDGARILDTLVHIHAALQLARFQPAVRACASVFWHRFCPEEARVLWTAKLKGFSLRNRLFPGDAVQENYVSGLQHLIGEFNERTRLYPPESSTTAGAYLFAELISGDTFVISQEADAAVKAFFQHLAAKGSEEEYQRARQALEGHPASEFELVRDWVRGFMRDKPFGAQYVDEVAAVVFCGDALKQSVVRAGTTSVLEGMRGAHPRIRESRYQFDYLEFKERLGQFEREVAPRFQEFQRLKQQWLERERGRLRLDDFRARVLTSFVRNQLIDRVYLPLIGDNLAKQIGAAGDQKRTDLMGLLLLISPPGYGKTTLMEYIANRLGIIFIKINGPALGHGVTSLDPEDAPNAAAREEIQKLNLALEMGDNVMICVDDIQHCNPEFLQKFISLCDGQRKIEGVWRGRSRTYDLRGRKVAVVMAGNPYTESGQKFKLPDMLANRADTYNLGDIIGGNDEWFKASYLENAVTSNPVLAPLANKSQKDIRLFIQMASSGEREAEAFEASYSAQEIEEILAVLRKLLAVRETVLRVNAEYIHSAGQADEYRTEPPFRLQGSYRNMNRLAEKVVPIMNDQEVQALILDHYQNEAQTLTTGAESNLLKFKELLGIQTPAEKARWDEIKQAFKRTQFMRAGDQSDPVGRVVSQLSAFHGGLESIQKTLEEQLARPQAPVMLDIAPIGRTLESLRDVLDEKLKAQSGPGKSNGDVAELANQFGEGIRALREELGAVLAEVHSGAMTERVQSLTHEMEMLHSTLATLKDIATQQRDHLRNAQELLAARARQGTVEIDVTQEMLSNERVFLEKIHQVLSGTDAEKENPPSAPSEERKS